MAKQKDLAELFDKYAGNIWSTSMIIPLANDLGVSLKSLKQLGIGINPLTGAYVFPERDNQGKIIGIMQRFPDGKKGMIAGSHRGLFYPVNPNYGDKHYESGAHNWERVGKGISCPICGKSDGCLVPAGNPSDPQAVVCVHIPEGAVKELELGYLHILTPEGNLSQSNQTLLPPSEDPVIVVEGYSDTATALDLGFVAVGRPSAQGKIGLLESLLRSRQVVIVGDNDAGAGQKGMEAVYRTLHPVCKSVIKVLPPAQFKDLRQWKNQVSLTQTSFLEWAEQTGERGDDPNVLEDDSPSTIAKTWLDQEKMQDELPTVRCYHGQWISYDNGHYAECDKEEFRGSIYTFLEGKSYPKTDIKGGITLVPYRSTRAKVSDIIDALSQWCPLVANPPVWLTDIARPDPIDLIAFQNGILDVNEYVRGHIKFYDATPALFSFNVLPYDYNENLESELWNNTIEDMFDGDKTQIKLLAQWFGYNCVPDMSLEKLMLCTGRPRSGKGTVLNTLAAMLGHKQCVSTSFQTLCTEFGYQPLMGKLAVLLSDAKVPREREAKAALEKILQIVGRDPIGVRRMYLSFLPQVYPKCRFTIAMNDLPSIPDQANALEPKLNILHFQKSYIGREDTSLKIKLQKEASEGKLINFALRGLRDLRQKGKFTITRSQKILLDQLRELTTPVASFIADCIEHEPPGDDYYEVIDNMFAAWVGWCGERKLKTGTKAQFGQWFINACPSAAPARIMADGRRHRVYRKIRLADWACQLYLGVNRG